MNNILQPKTETKILQEMSGLSFGKIEELVLKDANEISVGEANRRFSKAIEIVLENPNYFPEATVREVNQLISEE